jgi:transcriptional regulator with GAF, ATPase, and Fis domain/GNAT superfamily N-acetyltransferase
MELALLPPILLAIAQQRSLDAVLSAISTAVASQPAVALARVWLRETDRSCPICARHAPGAEGDALHLRASTGHPLDRSTDWSRLDGAFHRIPLGAGLKIASIASSGEPIRIDRIGRHDDWIRSHDWIRDEELRGFAGRPLVFGGETLGVLGVFRRVELDDGCWEWLRILSDAAAIAVRNARALEEAESLRRALELERDYLREEVRDAGSFGEILGRSPALHRALRDVDTVAATDTSVLILGESGTGKELVARAIHQRSRRAGKPLVKVNCGSIPRELFESEFFGHVRGSFTGAVRDRTGRFQLADGGTLFLDEVGEIPLDQQAKLLRVLQDGEFERVGDDVTRRVNVRVLGATNRDLEKEVADGRFRLDLFYRLGVFPIEMPPLRNRQEDIPDLVGHFVRQCCARLHVAIPRVPVRELDRARQYDWPGNIRELQNVVERGVLLARGGTLEMPLPAHCAEAVVPPVSSHDDEEILSRRQWEDLERTNILRALRQSGFRLYATGGAAERLGINAGTLASRLKKLGINVSDLKRSQKGGHRGQARTVKGAPAYTVTTARPRDLPLLADVELAAARLLAGHAPESVLAETTSQDDLREAQCHGHLWVALADDVPVGFAHVKVLEPSVAHLEEMDVHPEHGRRGLGTRLVLAVSAWAAAHQFEWVTLTTFRDVPWNMPLYSRLGFEVIPPEKLSPAMRDVLDDESRRGLDSTRRVAMRLRGAP